MGNDNRATAAFLIGRALGDCPTLVGAVLCDLAVRCDEDCEIGSRTALRAHFPKVVLSGEALGEDSAAQIEEAVARLLKEQPALGATYNVEYGDLGFVEALRGAGCTDDLLHIGHERNAVTVRLLRERSMDCNIAQNPAALRQAVHEAEAPVRDSVLLDFAVYSRFNLPDHGLPRTSLP